MKSRNIFQLFLCLTLILSSSCKASEDLKSSSNTAIIDENLDSDYTATCLERKPDDSKSFGSAITVSDNYLAIGDRKRNRVAIYTRSNDGTWQRKHEIYPPEDSLAQKLGYGFPSSLVIKNNILAIKSIGNKRRLKNKKTYLLAELYVTNLDHGGTNSTLKRISYPEPDKTAINSLTFFGENIAFAARTINDNNHGVNRVYIANSTSGEIVSSIESAEMQYPNQEIDIYNRFRVQLETHKNLLLLGDLDNKLWYNSIFRLAPDEKLEKIKFDREQVDGKQPSASHFRLTDYRLLGLATSNELTAIRRNYTGDQNTLIFTGFPEISEFKIIESSGILDAYKSHVLISHRTAPGMMPVYTGQPDHTLVGLEDNKILVKSDIYWERYNYYEPPHHEDSFIYARGILGEQELFLRAYGKLVYLPIKNLPKKYEIKLNVCGEE